MAQADGTTEAPITDERERRAWEAAEALAAEGLAVTGRAVRERSKVRMDIASGAARLWKERAEEQEQAPEIPAEFLARVQALWPAAWVAARDSFDVEREGLLAAMRQAQAERDGIAEDLAAEEAAHESDTQQFVADLEVEREARKQAEEMLAARHEELSAERTRAERAEAALEAAQQTFLVTLATLQQKQEELEGEEPEDAA